MADEYYMDKNPQLDNEHKIDVKGLKGKDLSDMNALKKSVQLPVEMSREEARRREELHKRLRGS